MLPKDGTDYSNKGGRGGCTLGENGVFPVLLTTLVADGFWWVDGSSEEKKRKSPVLIPVTLHKFSRVFRFPSPLRTGRRIYLPIVLLPSLPAVLLSVSPLPPTQVYK